VQIVGSTPSPYEAFVVQMARTMTDAADGCAAPNCNAVAERFVRSIKEEGLNRLVILGEAHLCRPRIGGLLRYYYRAA
jgi:hypothetical protein